MKFIQKTFKIIIASLTTLFITFGVVMAVDVSLNEGAFITSQTWEKISGVMDELTYSSGEMRVAHHIKVKKICSISGDFRNKTDLNLINEENISTAKWNQLKDIMAKMTVTKNSGDLPSVGDNDNVLSIAKDGVVYVYGSVCVSGNDNILGTSDDICLTPKSSMGNCFPSS